MSADIRNIGIFASVDMGKTTLTEQMLYLGGAITQQGSVDKGTAKTDDMDIERARGISVRAALANIVWNGCSINIIDTPGHTDFSTQVAKSLWALDGAVLVLSACDEINAYSKLIFDSLTKNHIPTLIFINKTDRETAGEEKTFSDIKKILTESSYCITPSLMIESNATYPEHEYEALAELDENLLEKYLNGDKIAFSEALQAVSEKSNSMDIFPVISGSALSGKNVNFLLDCILELLPPPTGDPKSESSGIIFSLSESSNMGIGAIIKMYDGTVSVRDSLTIDANSFKITQITKLSGLKNEKAEHLMAGEIGTVYGISSARVSQHFGHNDKITKISKQLSLQSPLLSADISIDDVSRLPELKSALDTLSSQDPRSQCEMVSAK